MVLAGWGQAFRQLLDDPRFRENRKIRVGVYIALGVFMYLILLGSILPPRYQFAVGQTSPVTVRSPMTTMDTLATKTAKDAAMQQVPKQYEQSVDVETNALIQVQNLFSAAMQVISNKGENAADKQAMVKSEAPKSLSPATLQLLLQMNPTSLQLSQTTAIHIVHNLLDAPFYPESIDQAGLLVDRQLLNYNLPIPSRGVVRSVVVSVLRPNMIYQKSATLEAQQAAAESVPDVMIHQGDVLVSRYGIVTVGVQSRLKDVGLYSVGPNYSMVVGFAVFMVIAIGLLAAYIERRGTRRHVDNLLLIILSLVFLLMGVLISLTKDVVNAGGPDSSAYLLPIALGAILITVLMDSSLAMVASFYFSFLFGAALGFNFSYVFLGFVSSLVGAYSVSKVTNRGTFMRAGFFVSGMNIMTVVAMHLLHMDNGAAFRTFSLHVGLAALNGVFAAILAMGILPFFESAFGLLTAIRLLELSNPNNPLLRKVLLEAPGTYHHSLIVGNLAEAAAEIVGADPLVCRVGAYYHDVGKTRRPMFFVENQMTKDNPHDKIAPSLSHLIITSHVTDGLDMLKRAGLPKPIQDICATHHGTTIIWYFYNKAKELDKNGTVKLDDFRYPGPKPKTRECAILMICDAVEAAVRSMSKPTPNRVEGVIRKIIRDRLQDGQLDQCDLTLQDLDVMVGAFMKTLKGIYHTRIEYPDIEKLRKEVSNR
jgi:cyclic-di-AMP phosphodiesterase PgpH